MRPANLLSHADARKLLGRLGKSTPRANKYGVAPSLERVADGIKFHSKKEANYYRQLVILRKAGSVLWFGRQVIFDLPGGVTYKADFVVQWDDLVVEIVDVKGMRTRDWIKTKKMVEAIHGISIVEA